MTHSFPFNDVGFFYKHETEDRTGNFAYSKRPDPNNGAIFFTSPVQSLLRTVCASVDEEKHRGYVALFPHIETFPNEEEFNEIIKGKYLYPAHAPPNTTPYMMLRGAYGKCVGIQVAIIHE